MQKPWLKSYPAGVPDSIDVDRYNSLADLLEASYERLEERNAAECMGVALTYHDVDRLSAALAAWLQLKGIEAGARVAIMMPNVLQYALT